jgi:hypothetical protein
VTIENLNPARLNETRTLQKVWFTDTAPKVPVVFDLSDPALTVYPPGAAGVPVTLTAHPYLGGLWETTPINFNQSGTWVLVWGSGSASGAQPEFSEIYETVLIGGSYQDIYANSATAATQSTNTFAEVTDPSHGLTQIKGIVGSATYGNAAIKAELGNVDVNTYQTLLRVDDAGFGLAAIKAELGNVYTVVSSTNSTLLTPTSGMRDTLNNVEAEITNGLYGLSSIKSQLSNTFGIVNNGTYGNAAIQTQLSSVGSNVLTISSNVNTILAATALTNLILGDPTYGLAALEAILNDPTTGFPGIASNFGIVNSALITVNTTALEAVTRADILRPDNIRMQVTEGDANLPTKVLYQFKTTGMLNFLTPYLQAEMEFKDYGGKPKVIFVEENQP